jgi:adenosylcobinamide-phosphate synthase
MAGALGVRLGGVNWYEGKAIQMPYMGDPVRPLEPPRIREAIRLMYACSIVAWLIAMAILVLKGGP